MTQPINSASRKENESESWSSLQSERGKCYKIACSPHRKWLICPQVKDHWLRRGENRGGWTFWSPNPSLVRSDRLAATPSLWFPLAWHSELRIWIWLALLICCTTPEAGRGRDSPCFPRRDLSGWLAGTFKVGRECQTFWQQGQWVKFTILVCHWRLLRMLRILILRPSLPDKSWNYLSSTYSWIWRLWPEIAERKKLLICLLGIH